MVKLYHYTSRVNVEEILRIGCLRRSTKHPIGWIDGKMLKNGAAFFTEKDPYNFTKEEIAKNNWGHGWKERVYEGLTVDAYIVIDVEEGNREFVFDSDPSHNVVAHLGDLQLGKYDCLWGYTDLTFKLLSFNIHHKTNVAKVAEFLNVSSSDIICLQECKEHILEQILSELTTMYFYHTFNGSAILSRFKFLPTSESAWSEHRGYLTVWVPDLDVFVTCLHLDHRHEGRRMAEMQELMEAIWTSNLGLMILAGDFNSLKREDYNSEQWEEISEVIRKSCSPQFNLIPISGEEV